MPTTSTVIEWVANVLHALVNTTCRFWVPTVEVVCRFTVVVVCAVVPASTMILAEPLVGLFCITSAMFLPVKLNFTVCPAVLEDRTAPPYALATLDRLQTLVVGLGV